MFVEIQAVGFAFSRDPQDSHRIHGIHHNQGNRESRKGDDGAADRLGHQQLRSSTVEKALERGGVVRRKSARRSKLTGCEEAERKRAPNTAKTVYRPCADRIVDAQPFQEFDAPDYDKSRNSAQQNRSGRSDPVTRTRDRNQTRQESVLHEPNIPFARHRMPQSWRLSPLRTRQAWYSLRRGRSRRSPSPKVCCRD